MSKVVFVILSVVILSSCQQADRPSLVMTVNGPVAAEEVGESLIHEHVLVDFIGADRTGYHRWNRDSAFRVILPHLRKVKAQGVTTVMECTPAYLGRDPRLLQRLSDESGLHLITNTGLYGAVDNKYLPKYAYEESADQISGRWISEFEDGIEDTGVRPGFMKISVNPTSLSDLHRKLVVAAVKTHLETGLTIASRTGPAIPAFEQLEVLQKEGVDPSAFIWVHAQNEKDWSQHVKAAAKGSWISLDGLSDGNLDEYLSMVNNLRSAGHLDRVLISHDAGWYDLDQPDGSNYRPHTTLFEYFLPLLREQGFSDDEIEQLVVLNPREAFVIKVRAQEK
jgi:phosphotriesterase-related protein